MFSERRQELIDSVLESEAKGVAVPGLCRVWTGLVLDEIERWGEVNGICIIAEAREVAMKSGLDHTFVRWWLAGDSERTLMDGTGIEGFPPYFGPESEAPAHLRNSRIDTWIMLDRKSR